MPSDRWTSKRGHTSIQQLFLHSIGRLWYPLPTLVWLFSTPLSVHTMGGWERMLLFIHATFGGRGVGAKNWGVNNPFMRQGELWMRTNVRAGICFFAFLALNLQFMYYTNINRHIGQLLLSYKDEFTHYPHLLWGRNDSVPSIVFCAWQCAQLSKVSWTTGHSKRSVYNRVKKHDVYNRVKKYDSLEASLPTYWIQS